MAVAAGTNGFDTLNTLIIGVPGIAAAVAGLFSWRNARAAKSEATHAKNEATQAKEEVASPNGHTTGEAVDKILRDIIAMQAAQSEFKESVRASRQLTTEVREEIRATREDLSGQITELREYTDEKLAEMEVRRNGAR